MTTSSPRAPPAAPTLTPCNYLCRAPWTTVAERLIQQELTARLKEIIIRTQGFEDRIVLGLMMRHFARCMYPNSKPHDLRLDELSWLLGVLVGPEHSGALLDALIEYLDAGVEESWYDAQLRRQYARELKRSASKLA